LIVGGTGLYLRAMLRGMTAGPEADWELRRLWEQRAREHGPEWLHATLQGMDPEAAARLHPNDMRRIIRAIEVFELTGRPISAGQQHGVRAGGMVARLAVWLDPERDWLRERIGQRVDVMMRLGWLDETRTLF
jgi:tRNA dimethylallyltransferase